MKKWSVFVFFLFQFAFLQVAQAAEPIFRNMGINEGLPSSEVYRIIQDAKGFIWFSTDAGVCRFNGRTIKCYTTADGLPDNTVFDLAEDDLGRIWMNCYNGTICYFEKGKFIIPEGAQELKKYLKKVNSIVTSIQFDRAQTLWIGTSVFPYSLKKRDAYSNLNSEKQSSDSANAIVYALDNGKTIESILSNNKNKLKQLVQNKQFCLQIKTIANPSKFYHFIAETPVNPKFFSCLLKDGRLLFSYKNKLIEITVEGDLIEHSFPKTIISIQHDNYGNVWIGQARGGVYFFEKGNLSLTPQIFLKDFSVSHLLFDREKGIWASTFEKGIFYAPFLNYFKFSNEPELSSSIAGIIAYGSKVYIATSSNHIFSIDKENAIKEMPYFKEANLQAKINFFPMKEKLILSGSLMVSLDTLNSKFTYLMNNQNQYFFAGAVGQGYHGRIAFVAQGLFYEIDKGELVCKIPLPARATSLYLASDAKLYVGTLNGLFVRNGNYFEVVNNTILASERINQITGDAKHLYVCTKNRGIFILQSGMWKNLTKLNGLASDICNYALADNCDTVWIATNKGISFFKATHPEYIQTLTISNGLPTNEISSLARRGNQLFVATREGLCWIDLYRDFINTIPPEIYISSVYENKNKEVLTNHARLNYYQNTIRFFVECPSYKKQFSPGYTYTLKGFSDSLFYSENEVLEFQNLDPGDYTFEIRGINNNSVYSKTAATFNFKINSPVWKKAWFIFLEILLLTGIIYAFVIWRIAKIRKQEKLKSDLNAMLNESRMTALQAQMNPHFIFNAINSIQSFILNNETQNAYDYLAKFAKLVRLVLNNSKQNSISLQTEIETLELYVQMEKIRFKNSFDFVVKFNEGEEDFSEISIPVMLIQPFIENAIWHGIMPLKEIRKGKIELRFTLHPNRLEIEIEDNGVGRIQALKSKSDKNHKSLGIQLVQERLELLDSKSTGKANLLLIDLQNNANESLGTLVKIIIPLPSYYDN